MHLKPAALNIRAAGFLLFNCTVWSTVMGCTVGEEKSTASGLVGSPGDINEAVLAACISYCEHIYDGPAGCDLELVAVEGTGCKSFCSVQAQSIPDQCEALFFDHFSCVIDEDVAYTCDDVNDSPQPATDTCASAATQANDCWRALSAG